MAARLYHNALARTTATSGFLGTSAAFTRSTFLTKAHHHQQQQQQIVNTAAAAAGVRMASSAAPRTYEWLVVIPDKPGMQAKRLEVRPQHFAGLSKAKEDGKIKMGGAILHDMPADDDVASMQFAGSTVILVAESRQAVLDALKDDVYVKSGVWDLEKAQIWPAKIALRIP